MAMYLIGDVQGCHAALQNLLNRVDYSPSRDTLVLLGDLVNRGPDSLGVLRRLAVLGDAARCLLGNHDLHLLATWAGVRPPGKRDTLAPVLAAPDAPHLLAWLRRQRMALHIDAPGGPYLCVHAGVLPAWTATKTMALAAEVEAVLTTPDLAEFLRQMYGDTPTAWHNGLRGTERLRVIVNALTRLRFCNADGHMEFATKEGAAAAPAGYMPWFDVPGRRSADVTVAFGHWSTLGWLDRPRLLALDSGCVWGRALTAWRLPTTPIDVGERIEVSCQ